MEHFTNNLEEFAERLKELRIERGLSIEKLAKELKVSHAAISRWESMQRIPSIEALILLSKFFGVTADYLLGLED